MADIPTAEREEAAAAGEALPDGSYPIRDCNDLHNAIAAYGRETGDRAALRRHITRRKIELGCPQPLPETWHLEGAHHG